MLENLLYFVKIKSLFEYWLKLKFYHSTPMCIESMLVMKKASNGFMLGFWPLISIFIE